VDLPQSVNAALGADVSALVQHVVTGSAICPTSDGIDSSLNARAAGMQHSNPRIQQDLDLWQRIKEYAQKLHLFRFCLKSKIIC
jgi:hypothetical protein